MARNPHLYAIPDPAEFRAARVRGGWRAALTLAALLLLALAVGLAACGSQGKPGGARPPPVVESLVVHPEEVVERVRFVGQLDAADEVILKPELSGIVDKVLFKEGQPVAAGAPILRLRDAEQRARRAEARARFTLAEDQFQRASRLRRQHASSAADLERARAERDIAAAQLELAEVQLARTVIRAPFAGVLGERMVSPGERVSPGGGDFGSANPTGLARLVALDRMELRFTVPESLAASLQTGLQMRIRVAAYPDDVFSGDVFFVAPRVDPSNRRLLVKASVANPKHKLRPGMFAQVEMKVHDHPQAIMIPEDAVAYTRDGTAVWRVRADHTTESVPVSLGMRQQGRVLVTGLRPGDRIVVAGINKVSEGKPVEALPQGGPAAASDAAAARSAKTPGSAGS